MAAAGHPRSRPRTIGLTVHIVLSILFGLSFAVAASRLRTNGSVALVGSMFGVLLYLVNFKVFAPIAFETFEGANQPFELVAHVIFGVILSYAFFSSGARRSDPFRGTGGYPPSPAGRASNDS